MFWLIVLAATWFVILMTLLFLHRHSSVGISNGRRLTLLSLLFVTPFAFAGYAFVKQPEAWKHNYAELKAVEDNKQENAKQLLENIDNVIANLEQRVAQDPQSIEERKLLASSYMVNKQPEKAVLVYSELMELLPGDADIPIRIAELKLSMGDGAVTSDVKGLIDSAIAIDEKHIGANWLLAIFQEQDGDIAAAIATLNGLMAVVTSQAQKESVERQLTRLEGLKDAAPIAMAPKTSEKNSEAVASVDVSVVIAPEWNDRVTAADTLFVYAYAVGGPRFPVAVYRTGVSALPLRITLDDSLAMVPDQGISNFTTLRIGAHTSRDGTAKAKLGDIYTEIDNVNINDLSEPLTLTLDTLKEE